MITRVISGGQTGVDQAALRAARAAGIPTGGFAPKGWLTEAGPAPWLADFGLEEMPTADYPPRTRRNIEAADATLILLTVPPGLATGGTALTIRLARESGQPWRPVVILVPSAQLFARAWFAEQPDFRTLNVAGPRESKSPGIGATAEKFLTELFTSLKGA